MRVVFDTNISVPAFAVTGGQAERAIRAATQGSVTLVTSPSLLAELATVLECKFAWAGQPVKELVQWLGSVAVVVRPTVHLAVLDDEPDNRVLECAVAGEAEIIVTGDRALLALGQYQAVRIVSLAEFLTDVASPAELEREA